MTPKHLHLEGQITNESVSKHEDKRTLQPTLRRGCWKASLQAYNKRAATRTTDKEESQGSADEMRETVFTTGD